MPARKNIRTSNQDFEDMHSLAIIKVRVQHGMCHEELSVHRSILCQTSGYMKERLKSSTVKETSIRVSYPHNFGLYVNWLYTGLLCTIDESLVGYDNEYDELIESYILGIKLKDSTFCNAVISAIFEKVEDEEYGGLPRDEDLDLAFTPKPGISEDNLSPMRDALVEVFARAPDSHKVDMVIKQKRLNRDFVRDLVKRLLELRNSSELSVCDFHLHDDGKDCSQEEPARKRRRQD
ncbi:hypothetical protein PRZ48_011957 [Zasmidium cellare]|uniref:BTB domain-containing protein n=1 Tax=Zasmidium cellare TaxID=395010 RepID=A0ABR0E7U5_ZASCE|nr:hypothetical protein PRZ48_011957 [Zasmidium cellare]